jgi:hypothetical protein
MNRSQVFALPLASDISPLHADATRTNSVAETATEPMPYLSEKGQYETKPVSECPELPPAVKGQNYICLNNAQRKSPLLCGLQDLLGFYWT